MGIFKSFFKGVTITNRNVKVVIYLWIINLIYSLLVFSPIYALIKEETSRSLMGDRLLQGFDLYWLGDMIHKYKDYIPVLIVWLIVPSIIYLAMYIFLNGGIIARIKDKAVGVSLRTFLSDCGHYFLRFFRLFLVSIPVYLIFLWLLFGLLSRFLEMFTRNAITEWPLIIIANIKILLFILMFTLVNMLFDYVKIRVVFVDGKSVLQETGASLKYLASRFFKAWGLYLFIGFIYVIISVLYMEIAHLLPKHRMLFILIVFLWQQVYIACRLWIKVNFFASQSVFFISNTPELEPNKGA